MTLEDMQYSVTVLLPIPPSPPLPLPQQSELLSLLHSLLSKGVHASALAVIIAEKGACLVAFAKAPQLKIRILIVQVYQQHPCGVCRCTFLSAIATYSCIRIASVLCV